MYRLFKEEVGLKNERPKIVTIEQKDKIFLEVVNDISEYLCMNYSIEEAAKDLESAYCRHKDSIDIANYFHEKGCFRYCIDSNFLEVIECISFRFSQVLSYNISLWVKSFDIKPDHEIGDCFVNKKDIVISFSEGQVIFIKKIYEKEAVYVLSEDLESNTGYLVPYEKVNKLEKIKIKKN